MQSQNAAACQVEQCRLVMQCRAVSSVDNAAATQHHGSHAIHSAAEIRRLPTTPVMWATVCRWQAFWLWLSGCGFLAVFKQHQVELCMAKRYTLHIALVFSAYILVLR